MFKKIKGLSSKRKAISAVLSIMMTYLIFDIGFTNKICEGPIIFRVFWITGIFFFTALALVFYLSMSDSDWKSHFKKLFVGKPAEK